MRIFRIPQYGVLKYGAMIGFLSFTTFINVFFFIYLKSNKNIVSNEFTPDEPLWNQDIDFEAANIRNDTGTPNGCYLVPNYVHFIKFGESNLTYIEMIVVLAALKNQKPEKIFFHRNSNNSLRGQYWKILMGLKSFTDILELTYVEEPKDIFGQPIEPNLRRYHGSDITRIRILIKYGGIFLDGDTYVIKSLNNFRRYEMTLNWDEDQFLGTQLLLAHKDARFLKLWLESYRGAYRGDLWYYNAGERPTKEILWKRPELVHRVKVEFGADTGKIGYILQTRWDKWRNQYAFHLLIHHQYLFRNLTKKATFPVVFDENNIGFYPITLRDMAYDVYDVANLSWPKEYKD